MIPCHICGVDAGTGWITGYIPAPDSQKMALCPAHDTPENRKRLRVAWHLSMIKAIQTAEKKAAYFATRGGPQALTIFFSAGGSMTMPCAAVSATAHNTLKVQAPDGAVSFFPLQHIRRYELAPWRTDEETAAPRS